VALSDDVAALAAMERRGASPGERASAEWIAARLREAGAEDVRVRPFRYQHTYAWAHIAHFAAGMLGSRLLAAAAAVSLDAEFSGRSQWVRRLLPAGTGWNVVARVPAAGAPRRTVVLVAHHDAAHTGLMWHPRVVAAARGRSFATIPFLGLALAALGLHRPARLLLGCSILMSLDVARGATVPGASDNATGVAAVLALVERYAREPLPGTELVALFPGCEESGMGGMAAWLREEGAALDPQTTLVLGLDTLGAGEPVLVAGEGPPRTVRYREADLALVDRAADRAGLPRPRRARIGGWTDPVLARFAGLPSVSLVSMRDGLFTNYHLPTDTPDRVDWGSVARCLALARAVIELPPEEASVSA
jgi:hypothetical protein